MFNTGTQAKEIQIGTIDKETHEMVKLINSFPLPGDFLHWLSGGNFSPHLVEQKVIGGKYKRIGQLCIREIIVFTGRLEIDLANFSKEAIQFFSQGKKPFLSTAPELSKFRLERKTKTSSESHYTIISDIINNDEIVGTSWEIYELQQIIQIYNNLEDPLRYWRNG